MATRNFNVKNGLTAGNITLDASTNTTTTSNLVATGNVSFTGANVSLGSVSNLKITGGTSGYVLQTDGTGNLSWVTQTTQLAGAYVFTQSTPATTWVVAHNLGVQYVNVQVIDATGNSYTGRYNYPTITFNNAAALTITFDSAVAGYAAVTSGGGQQNVGGSNTQIQFNDANVLGGSAAFTFNKTSNLVSMGGALSVTGNANVGNLAVGTGTGGSLIGANLVSANFITGTLTTAAQPNITSVGTLSSLAVTGNVTAGNFVGTLANGNSNVNIATSAGNVNITVNGTSRANFTTSGLAVNGTIITGANVTAPQLISNVATGTAPFVVTSTTQVANLSVATAGSATTAGTVTTAAQPNITSVGTLTGLTSNGNTTVNLAAGNSLTVAATAPPTADMVTITNTGQNVATAGVSGLQVTYVGGAGAIEASAIRSDMTPGTTSGSTWNAFRVAATTAAATGVTFNGIKFDNKSTGAGTSRVFYVGTGYDEILNYNGTVVINGNGTVNASQVTGTVSSATTAGTVTTAAQPNITSVGTLTSLAVTGNTTSGNFIGIFANGNSNVNIPSANGNVNITSAGNTILVLTGVSANLTGTMYASGRYETAFQVLVRSTSSVGNGYIDFNAGATSGNILIRDGSSFTNRIFINPNGNVGIANSAPDHTLSINGTLNATGNANVGNIGATNGVFTNVSGNGSALSSITGANVTGTVSSATTATTAGTVTTAAQPNITSVGTLTGLTLASATTFQPQIVSTNFTNDGFGPYWNTRKSRANAIVQNGDDLGTFIFGAHDGNTYVNSAYLVAEVDGTPTANSGFVPSLLGFYTSNTTSLSSKLTIYGNGLASFAGVISGNGSGLSAIAGANVTGTVANATYATSAGSATSATTATTAGTVTTAAQPNITSVGTLTSLAVTGNTTAGNVYANSGTIGASLLTGTLTTASQPNVTSVGTLTSLAVTGNVTAGNLYANSGVVGANTLSISNTASIGGNLAMNSKNITGLANPVNPQDAATKNYVDAAIQGLHVHDSCYVATTTTLATSSGGTTSYNNGSSGVGATITTTGTYTTIDGLSIATVGTRVLVKNESNAAWNGIYTYTNATTLTRSTDFDTSAEAAGGDFVFITSGSTQADTGWVQTTDNPTLGTSNIVWTQFSGAGTYSAGTGLTLTGTVFSITNTAVTAGSYGNGDRVATFTVNSQGQLTAASNTAITANAANLTGTTLNSSIVTSSLTSVGTLGSLSVTGNANTGNLGTTTVIATTGNITTINSGLMQNGNSNVAITANGNVTVSAVGGARITATSTGANVTGTLGVSGNANVGNLGTAQVLATANITAPQLISNVATGTAPFVVTSTTQVANLSVATAGSATTAGTVTTAAQPNITSVGTLSSLAITSGAATKLAITANAVPTSDMVTITNAGQGVTSAGVNGIALTYVGGAAAVEASAYRTDFTPGGTTGGTWNGYRFVAASNAASGVTMNAIKIDNITGGAGTENMIFAGTGWDNILNYNGTSVIYGNGTVNASQVTGTVSSATTAGTVTTAAQPNITSVGTLTSLAVTGNVTAGNIVGTLANGNSNISIPAANGNINISAGGTPNELVITNTGVNVAGTLNATGNANVGNLGTAQVLATANITAPQLISNVATGTAPFVVTSTTQVANLSVATAGTAGSATTAGTVTTAAQPNITSVGTLTGLTANGNVTINQNAAEIFTVSARQAPTSDMVSITNSGQAIATAGVNLLNLTFVGGAAAVESSAYRTDFTPGSTTGGTWNGYRMVASAGAASGVTMNAFKVDNITGGAGTENMFFAGTGWDNILNYNGTSVIYGNGTVNGSQVVGTVPSATSATTAGTVTTAAQPNITSVGTLTSLGVNGTITAVNITANTGVFTGNGSGLSALNASNISTGTLAQARLANASVTLGSTALTLGSTVTTVAGLSSVTSTTFVGSLSGAATTAGTVTTAAQPNITSVGTLTGLTIGNATANAVFGNGTITLNSGLITGNGAGLSQLAGANVTGTVANATYAVSAGTAGTVTTAAQPNITSVGTLTSLGVNGTITGVNITANTGVFTGNGSGLSALNASNISTGTLAQARLANASVTLGSTALTLGSTVTTVAGLSSVTSTTFVGTLSGAATTAGTVTTAAQPNITSVGTLTSLTVSGSANLSSSSGNVGIGTTSPKSKLQVTGLNNLNAPVLGNAANAPLYVTNSDSAYGLVVGTNASDGRVWLQAQRTDGTATAYNITLNEGGGNVGIGTSSATTKLDVAGDIKVKSNIAYVSPNGANTINSTMLNGGTLAWSGNAGQLFSITDSMSGNIFSVNDVSGIPMISVDAGGNIQFAASGGFVEYGVTTGITAAGSTQGTATILTRPINVVSTVSSGANGIILPTVPAGARIIIVNTSANALNVYPPSGAVVNSGSTNAAYSQPAGARLEYFSVSTTQWYTLNATYG